MKLTDKNWKPFRIGTIFKVLRGRRFIAAHHKPGNIPYCSASDKNNGVTDFISNPLFIEDNAIIYSTFGDCYYMEGKFTASDEINILKNENLNVYSGRFISTVLSANKYKYQFVRKAFQNKIIDEQIYLPVNNDGNPDWKWIEQYMKSLEQGIDEQMKDIIDIADGDKDIIKIFAEKVEINNFRAWLKNNEEFDVNNQISNKYNKQFNRRNMPLLNLLDRQWKEFKLTDIFHCGMGNGIDASKVKFSNDSNINYVSRTSINNGIVAQVDLTDEQEPFEEGKLTLALGGEYLGSCFVQPDKFYTAQNVAVLSCKDSSISHGAKQFIATIIRNEAKIKYFAFGRELNSHYKTDFTIVLPINTEGNPDYQFMDNYMSQIENSLVK